MTQQTKDITELLKAWAFPVLLSVVGFFMHTIYNEFQELKQVQQKILERMAVHDERHTDIERRLDDAESNINDLIKWIEAPSLHYQEPQTKRK